MMVAKGKGKGKSKGGLGTREALDNLAAAVEKLAPARRAAFEREMLTLQRRATYRGLKRGPKPKLGETMTEAVLVKCTPALKAEMAAAAERLGLDSIAGYLREVHGLFIKSGTMFRKLRDAE